MVFVFDFDGTLHDTARLYGQAVRSALAVLPSDFSPRRSCTDGALSRYLGMTAQQMWEDFIPELPESLRLQAMDEVARQMNEGVRAGQARLYEGIPALLSRLKEAGHTLLILSNCYTSYMDAHRAFFSLDLWFSGYYCSQAYGDIPKEDIFLQIRSDFPGNHVMIGDRASDIRVGLIRGIPTIACAYGFGSSEEYQGADWIVNSVRGLEERLLRCNESRKSSG